MGRGGNGRALYGCHRNAARRSRRRASTLGLLSGACADAVMQVDSRPSARCFFAFLSSAHRLVNWARRRYEALIMPPVSLLFQLGEIGFGRLISDRNLRV